MSIKGIKGIKRVKLAIFDWAGTIIDHGSRSPIISLSKAFSKHGINLNQEQLNFKHGTDKYSNIMEILKKEGKKDNSYLYNIADQIYSDFKPILINEVDRNSKLIPEFMKILGELTRLNITITTNTGYTTDIMNILISHANKQGFFPKFNIASDHPNLPRYNGIPYARPYPYMIENIKNWYKESRQDNILDTEIIKIGDTEIDIEEAINAKVIPISVIDSSVYMGLNQYDFLSFKSRLPISYQNKRIDIVNTKFKHAKYLINNMTELPNVINDINKKLEYNREII